MDIEGPKSMDRYYTNTHFEVYILQYRIFFSVLKICPGLPYTLTQTPPLPLEINGKDGSYYFCEPFHNQNSGVACVISPGGVFS